MFEPYKIAFLCNACIGVDLNKCTYDKHKYMLPTGEDGMLREYVIVLESYLI